MTNLIDRANPFEAGRIFQSELVTKNKYTRNIKNSKTIKLDDLKNKIKIKFSKN